MKLAYPTYGLEDHSLDFGKLNGNDSFTLYRNLSSFGPVTCEFITFEFVQQSYILTGVSFGTG